MAVDLPSVDDFLLERLLGLAMAFATDRPSVHFRGDVAEGRHLADLVKVLLRRIVGRDTGFLIKGHGFLLSVLAAPQNRAVFVQRDTHGCATFQSLTFRFCNFMSLAIFELRANSYL